jgi:hypothetical protein
MYKNRSILFIFDSILLLLLSMITSQLVIVYYLARSKNINPLHVNCIVNAVDSIELIYSH